MPLSDVGATVIEAASAQAAIDYIEKSKPSFAGTVTPTANNCCLVLPREPAIQAAGARGMSATSARLPAAANVAP
jgi:hypothetical protein